MTRSRDILGPRHYWTKREFAILRRRYPNEDTDSVAKALGRTRLSVYNGAQILGISKSSTYLKRKRAAEAARLTKAGISHRYPKGHVPANKGLRRPGFAPGRMRETQFKKGERSGIAAAHWVPIGSYRINGDGYLDQKITDDGLPQRHWVGVHRLVWMRKHGTVPKGKVIVFKPGRRTTDPDLITIDALEAVTRQELMRRNSCHTNLPKELVQIVQLRGAIARQVNRLRRAQA